MRRKYLFITILYAIFVFWLSIQPIIEPTPDLFPYQDKVVHIFLYTILSLLITLGMIRNDKQYLTKIIPALSIIISFFYGFFIEICQIFVPTRSFEVWDLLANLIGSITGVILATGFLFIISTLFSKQRISP